MNSPDLLRIKKRLERLQPGLVAVSGGVDSRFLARLIANWQLDFRPVFFAGPLMRQTETEQAIAFLKGLGLEYDILSINPLQQKDVADNSRRRCYYCKQHLFRRAQEHAFSLDRNHVLEGSHLSDREIYRPGLKALSELGIQSPLAESGFSKADIRSAARRIGLERADQPSRPCLMTRFDYDYAPQADEVLRIGQAEDGLERLGMSDCRIRILGPGQIVLQLLLGEEADFEARQQAVGQVMNRHGLGAFRVTWTRQLSGYFD